MRSPLQVSVWVLAALLAAPAAASADPSIAVDRPCYASPAQRADTVRLTGSGFAPNSPYTVTLDGQPLGGATGTTDAAGNLAGSFAPPAPPVGVREAAHVLAVQQGDVAASTPFSVARLLAAFTPAAGDPSRLRVRFEVVGFGLSGATAPPVYLHYVRPDGRPLWTVKLGTASGPCGSLTADRPRRLFPFAARGGSWRLQFDTARTYRRVTAKSRFLFFAVTVKVQAG